ncbi:MAG: MarR family transcriptional regulator [Solobacterium sp.]|nr:MarR family transcriptional regulator [Solobacterium sp.]
MTEKYDCLRLDHQICFPLYAAARKVTGRYTPYFRELGITYTQYIVFMALWQQDDQTVSEICTKLYLDSGTLTPLLKKMEERGWLKRTRSKEDERIVRITLTEEGWALRDRCLEIPAMVGSCIHLSQKDAEDLYRILHLLLEGAIYDSEE